MKEVIVMLSHGLTVGEKVHLEAAIRELTAGDIFDAQTDAERLVHTETGPQLVASPSAVGIHTLRRQIRRIGEVEGPLSMKELRKLHPVDLERLQQEAMQLEQAAFADIASREVTQRGRTDEGLPED